MEYKITDHVIAETVMLAMSRGGTWAARNGGKPARKRYAVKRGRVVRRSAAAEFTAADLAENARAVEATRAGGEIILVSYS